MSFTNCFVAAVGLDGSGVVADEEPADCEEDDERPSTSAPRSEGAFEDVADVLDGADIVSMDRGLVASGYAMVEWKKGRFGYDCRRETD